MVVWAGNTPQT